MSTTSTGTGGSTSATDTRPGYGAGRRFAWFLLVTGGVGFLAAFDLTVEKIALLKDPAYELSCNINPLLSCGSIVTTWQAELFGFPNPLLGIAGFTVVITTAMALLAGATFRRWYWIGLNVGSALAVVLIGWLIYQSLYAIGALCPYCMVVWAVTIPIFLYVSRLNLQHAHPPPDSVRAILYDRYVNNTAWLVLLSYLVIAALIAIRFWDFWSTLW